MLRPSSSGEGLLKATKVSQAQERDDIQRRLATVLILKQAEGGSVRSPVITLSTEKTSIYNVVEKHLKPEAVVSTDRWWRLARNEFSPNLEPWRPRVNGTQLKALQGVRLPETEGEWQAVRDTLAALASYIKEESSPDAFLTELKELTAYCEQWWENRTKREGSSGTGKRTAINGASLPIKRQRIDTEADGAAGPSLAGELPGNHPLLSELAAAAVGGSAYPRAHQSLTRAGIAGPGNGIHLGPGGEPVQGYMDMMTAEQAAHAGLTANGFPSHSLANGPLGDLGSQQGGRLGARLPALTVVHGEVRQTEWVALNVGGRLLQTELGTLTAVPDSHLAQLATAWQSFPHQQIFLDRSPQAFEALLEHLRAANCGEAPPRLPDDPGRLSALHREALHFALPGIAERVGEALQELSASQEEAKVGSSQGPWQYDAVYAETGFHKQAHNHIQAALHAANIEIQNNAEAGWEVFDVAGGSHSRTGADGASERNLFYQFLLRRPLAQHGANGQ